MKYYHGDINQWRQLNNVRLTGNYGGELAALKGIIRNPYNTIIATGFYFYNKNCKEFFKKCLDCDLETLLVLKYFKRKIHQQCCFNNSLRTEL